MNMSSSNKETGVPGCVLVIFGAGGDLTKRLLLPALYNLAANGMLPDEFRIVGAGKDEWDDAMFQRHIADSLKEFWGGDTDPRAVEWLKKRASYRQMDFNDGEAFGRLRDNLKQVGDPDNYIFYLAVAPTFIAGISASLFAANLLKEESGNWRRLVVEKPFGHDLPSAVALNDHLQEYLGEKQIYRIDHFAGKDAVQDIAVLRFANSMFEPLWHSSVIDSVQITVAETVGVEKRAAFYEKSGALRDMVPNHLAEIVSFVAMEPPLSLDAQHLRERQQELMKDVRTVDPEKINECSIRAQYTAGTLKGVKAAGYREEPDVASDSETETYVAMRIEIENDRWRGVPFYLRTGKRLNESWSEVVITFRPPHSNLFHPADKGGAPKNQLVLRLKPEPQISMMFGTKTPGLKPQVQAARMHFKTPAGPFGDHATGYERLLHDVMAGNKALFQSAEFVIRGWQMIQPLLDAWPTSPMHSYPAGSAGPLAADEMLRSFGHAWHPVGKS